MKRVLIPLFASCLLIMASCNADDAPNPTPTPTPTPSGGTATLSAARYGFDGQTAGAFSSTTAGIAKVSAAGVTTLTISGIEDGGSASINIVLYGDFSAPAKFKCGSAYENGIVIRKNYQNVSDLTMSYSTDNDAPNMTGGGEVEITKVDGNKIEGKFYAVGHNSAGSEAYAEQGTFSGTVN